MSLTDEQIEYFEGLGSANTAGDPGLTLEQLQYMEGLVGTMEDLPPPREYDAPEGNLLADSSRALAGGAVGLAQGVNAINAITPSPISGGFSILEKIGDAIGFDALAETFRAQREGHEAFRGLGGPIATALTETRDSLDSGKSELLKEQRQARSDAIAAEEGLLGKTGAAVKETLTQPRVALDDLLESGAILGATALAGRAALKGGASLAQATGAAVGTGATLEGGLTSQDVFDEVMAIPDPVWAEDPETAERLASGEDLDSIKRETATSLARNSAGVMAAVSGAANLLPGARVVEQVLVRNLIEKVGQGGVKGALKSAGKGAVGEGFAEGVEGATGQGLENVSVRSIDPSREIDAGVADAAAHGVAAGLVPGAGVGLVSGGRGTGDAAPAGERRNRTAPSDTPSNTTRTPSNEPTLPQLLDALQPDDPLNESSIDGFLESVRTGNTIDYSELDTLDREATDSTPGETRSESVLRPNEGETNVQTQQPIETRSPHEVRDGRDEDGRLSEVDATEAGQRQARNARGNDQRQVAEDQKASGPVGQRVNDPSDGQQRTQSAADSNPVQRKADRTVKRTNGRVVHHRRVEALDEDVARIVSQGDRAVGWETPTFYHNGQIHVLSERIDDESEVDALVAHEALHAGLRDLLGDDATVADVLNQLYQDFGDSEALQKMAQRFNVPLGAYTSIYAQGENVPIDRLLEELMAHREQRSAEDAQGKSPPRRVFDAFVDAVWEFLERFGFTRPDGPRSALERELVRLARRARQAYDRANRQRTFTEQEYRANRYALKPRDERNPLFSALYSASLKLEGSATGPRFLNQLRRGDNVTKEEIEHTGLEDYLLAHPSKIPAEQVQEFILQNGVALDTVVAGEGTKLTYFPALDPTKWKLQSVDRESRGEAYYFEPLGLTIHSEHLSPTRRKFSLQGRDKVVEARWFHQSLTQFQDEIRAAYDDIPNHLIPDIANPYSTMHRYPGEFIHPRDYLLTLPEFPEERAAASHYSEVGNVLAFARTTIRSMDGHVAFFIDQLQSDWHHKGARRGYRLNKKEKAKLEGELKRLYKGRSTLADEVRAEFKDPKYWSTDPRRLNLLAGDRVYHAAAFGVTYTPEGSEFDDALSTAGRHKLEEYLDRAVQLHKKWDQARNAEWQSNRGVHDAPGRDYRWVRMAMRRVIAQAVSEGRSHIAWGVAGTVKSFSGTQSKKIDAIYDTHAVGAAKKVLGVNPQRVDTMAGSYWIVEIPDQARDNIERTGLPMFALKQVPLLPEPNDRSTVIKHDPDSVQLRRRGFIGRWLDELEDGFVSRASAVRKLIDYYEIVPWGTVTARSNPKEKEILAPGRIGNQLDAIKRFYIQGVAERAYERKLSLRMVDLFVYAKHAPERNRRLRERFGLDTTDEPSGMSDETARDVLARFDELGLTKHLEHVAELVWEMNQMNIEISRDLGLISDALYEEYDESYEFFVPLKNNASGSEDARRVNRTIAGNIGNIHGKEFRLAKGRFTLADSPIGHTVADLMAKAVRAEYNAVTVSALQFFRDNPDDRMWEIYSDDRPEMEEVMVRDHHSPSRRRTIGAANTQQPPADRRRRPSTYHREWRARNMNDPERYLRVKERGKQYYVHIKDKRLREALIQLTPDRLAWYLRWMRTVTRTLAGFHTAYNIAFPMPNFIRDFQTGIIKLMAEETKDSPQAVGERIGQRGGQLYRAAEARSVGQLYGQVVHDKVRRDMKKGFGAAWHVLNDSEDASIPMHASARLLFDLGGKTGYWDSKDAEEMLTTITTAYRKQRPLVGAPERAMEAITGTVETLNLTAENAVRITSFHHAREALHQALVRGEIDDSNLGFDRSTSETLENDRREWANQKAAVLAKELTVNFNARGKYTAEMQALFMFFNASMQGVVNTKRALYGMKGDKSVARIQRAMDLKNYNAAQKAVGAGVIAGILWQSLFRQALGEDEDGVDMVDKIPYHVKSRNLWFPLGWIPGFEKDQVGTFPIGYGINVFPMIGYWIEDSIANGTTGMLRGASNFARSVIDSFSPIGAEPSNEPFGWLGRTLAPEVAKPIVEQWLNENYFGGSIFDEPRAGDEPIPYSEMGRKGTPNAYKGFARWANDITGGSRDEPGWLDWQPERYQHILNFAGGGAYRSVSGLINEGIDVFKDGEPIQPERIPVFNRFYSRISRRDDEQRFYDRVDVVKQRSNALERAVEEDDEEAVVELYQKHGETVEMRGEMNEASDRLRALRKDRQAVYADEELTPRQIIDQVREIEDEMDVVIDDFNLLFNEAYEARELYR